jgi:hypothetical protein
MRKSLIPPRAKLKFCEILSFDLQDQVSISLVKWLFWQTGVADTTVYGRDNNKEILRLPFDDFVSISLVQELSQHTEVADSTAC